MAITELLVLLLIVFLVVSYLVFAVALLLLYFRVDELTSDLQLYSERLVRTETIINTHQKEG